MKRGRLITIQTTFYIFTASKLKKHIQKHHHLPISAELVKISLSSEVILLGKL